MVDGAPFCHSCGAPCGAPHILPMEKKVAAALALKPVQVSVKAKSGEGLDAVGRGVAIRADAVALIQFHS